MVEILTLEENTTGEWECICYCEDEDQFYRMNIPVGTSCDDFFDKKPKCMNCGNTNLYPAIQNRPDGFDKYKAKREQSK